MARLDAKARKALPASKFALPKERKFPVENASHAKNAKARASQAVNEGRMSKAEEQKIDRKADAVLGKGRTKPEAKKAPAKKMTAKEFERTSQDRKMDREGAKKAKEPISKWEGSKADRAADKKALTKINAKRKGK